MSVARQHAEWLSLVETSGPFLSMPVLLRVFPQGLEPRDPDKASRLREAYEDWLERHSKLPAVHHAWIRHVLTELLEYPPEFLVEGQAIPPGIEAVMANYSETIRPDYVLLRRSEGENSGRAPALLIGHYAPDQDLEKPVAGKIWKASPGTRMMELLHAADVPLGLITNGEQWMIVYAPRGETTGFASWYADMWMQEPLTLRAFHSLIHLRRFLGVAEPETLAALYAESAKDQHEVTDQLGYQVRRAVGMLVQAFDRADVESGRTLLAGVKDKDLYDSALTIMMRLVFLFSADERGLLLLGDPLYDQHYAVSTLSELLRERADQHGEELLERRQDAWCRLLATFRAVHAGVEHEAMRLPPYGGTLFDPDRYPFLEGRAADTKWQKTTSKPLPINNRVVLHLLEALQYLRVKVPGGGPAEARRLSFRALDIEQIGHVYEGLLDHTAKRASEVILGLAGAKNSEPEIPLAKLEELATNDKAAFVEFLKEKTSRSEKALVKNIEKQELIDDHALLIACGQDPLLAKRVRPLAGLLREDDFGQLVVIPAGSVYVTAGSDRRSTGTHYTPRSLTEPIVQHTLEPLVYTGPAEGKPEAEWKLKSPRELLALKICDMTMGSGAFLVQTCRFLSERLVEAWENAEHANPGKILFTPEGDFSGGDPGERLIPTDPAERLAIARRYVADRCLYGVDINPMAVEMAKLSLWLITLQRDRPFTFLDHALKCGDSLLGVSSVQQIENFSLRPGERQVTFATANLFRYVEAAIAKRRTLEDLPSNDYTQIETKQRLHTEAQAAIAKVKALADALIAFELRGLDGDAYEEQRATEAEQLQLLMARDADASLKSQISSHPTTLSTHAQEQLCGRRPFHWPVEFPEVFARGGFDAFVGNPPFMGGSKISGNFGDEYRSFITLRISEDARGNADLCAYFFLRAKRMLRTNGLFGLLATNSIAQGNTREVGLEAIIRDGGTIICTDPGRAWPGVANLEVAITWIYSGDWNGRCLLGGNAVDSISSYLTSGASVVKDPFPLACCMKQAFKGSGVNGLGFLLTPSEALDLRSKNTQNERIIFQYLNGKDIVDSPDSKPSRWVINFGEMTLEEARDFVACFEIIERLVKPQRANLKEERARTKWWLYERPRPDLYESIASMNTVVVVPRVSSHHVVVLSPVGYVFADSVIVIAHEGFDHFAVLQSWLHEVWAHRPGQTTLETRNTYFPESCFETFVFPNKTVHLSRVGEEYYTARNQVCLRREEGLTKTYNRFHDRGEQSADIARLRALHVEMDQAVAAAYGWSDLDLGHGFHATKQGERYTISEPARRTVLDRLLALNHQRYADEVKAGLHEKGAKKAQTTRKSTVVAPAQEPQELGLDFSQPVAAKPKLDAAATAFVLIPFLLSEASRAKVSLRMSELKLAFDFITNATLMEAAAKPPDRVAVKAWSGTWQSPAGPDWFIKTLRQLASGTVRATTDEDDPPLALIVAPTQPDSPELREGIRLAVRVARSAGTMPPEERVAIVRERRSIFATV
jgi:hypothetical protein